MARPYIMPLGFIDRTTDNGAVFVLNNPGDSAELKPGTPVTVWRYSPDQLALAKIRGLISNIGYVTARFRTVESIMDDRWPGEEEVLRKRTPVYLALEDSFEPDPGRMLTQEQTDRMERITQSYRILRSGRAQSQGRAHGVEEDK